MYWSPPPWTFGARGALLYASCYMYLPLRSLGSYRAVPKGAGLTCEFLARKFC